MRCQIVQISFFFFFSWHSIARCSQKILRELFRLNKNISISVQLQIKRTDFFFFNTFRVHVAANDKRGDVIFPPLSWLQTGLWTPRTLKKDSIAAWSGCQLEDGHFISCSSKEVTGEVSALSFSWGKKKVFLLRKNSWGIARVTLIPFFSFFFSFKHCYFCAFKQLCMVNCIYFET